VLCFHRGKPRLNRSLKTAPDLVSGIWIEARGARRDALPVADVFEIKQIAVGVDAKDHAVAAADHKAKVVEPVSDLVSGIWTEAGSARGVALSAADVIEIEKIAVGVYAKDYAVAAADKTSKVVEPAPDLVSGICVEAGGARGDALPVADVFEIEEVAVGVDAKDYAIAAADK
jgi:hypothetical protein